MSKEINTPENNSEELDLGQLFKQIGKMFDRFFNFLGSILNKLFLAFVWCVFFVKKHIILLLIAAVLGFGYGYLKENSSVLTYKSSVLISQNYQTGETIYNTINYYNELLSDQDYRTLAQELSIDTAYVSTILGLGIEELITANQRLIQYDSYIKKLDSTLATTIDYNDYNENVAGYIFKTQQITINSSTNENFNVVFEAIVKSLNSNTYFKREQEKDIRELENRRLAIEYALNESDSLQGIYKMVLENVLETKNGSQTSITIEGADDENKTREFELYKNDIKLRNELVLIERAKEDKEFIIEILSNTPSKGFIDTSIEFLDKEFSPKTFFIIIFPFLLFSALLMLRFIKYLEKFNSKT